MLTAHQPLPLPLVTVEVLICTRRHQHEHLDHHLPPFTGRRSPGRCIIFRAGATSSWITLSAFTRILTLLSILGGFGILTMGTFLSRARHTTNMGFGFQEAKSRVKLVIYCWRINISKLCENQSNNRRMEMLLSLSLAQNHQYL